MTEIKTPFPEFESRPSKSCSVRIVIKSVVYSLAIIGCLSILGLTALIAAFRKPSENQIVVPEKTVLTVDFDEPVTELRGDDLLSDLTGISSSSYYDLIASFNRAAGDARVKAVIAKVGMPGLGLAQIQELRKAVENLRSKGKKTYLYADGFGSFGGGTGAYYLASAFDEIWMMPNTEAGITGISLEVPFFKKVLQKIGVEPEFYTRYEYKNAVASLTEDQFGKAFKAQMEQLGGSVFEQIVADISASRKIEARNLRKLINNAPLPAEDAKKSGLVDKIGYKPELIEAVKQETGGELLAIGDYKNAYVSDNSIKNKIAFMVIDGVINSGESNSNPLNGEITAGSDSVVEELEKISEDEAVKALVLRINSPGGSYSASNEIWYALNRLKQEKEIPIVVSMGDYAASGGYFIALAGDYVFAEPSTITGSIGVLGGKMVLSGLWNKLGINWGTVNFGENAGILSANRKFSKREREIFNRSLDNVYADFTAKVSEARHIASAQMDKIARGRVWTGQEALGVGLVDAVGGITEAAGKARELSGLKSGEAVKIEYYPKPKTLQEKLAMLMGSGANISVNKAVKEMGFELKDIKLLNRLKYETALPPFEINY